jgi:hypothetical protein
VGGLRGHAQAALPRANACMWGGCSRVRRCLPTPVGSPGAVQLPTIPHSWPRGGGGGRLQREDCWPMAATPASTKHTDHQSNTLVPGAADTNRQMLSLGSNYY